MICGHRWTPRQAAQHPFITGAAFTAPFTPQPDPMTGRYRNPPAHAQPVAASAGGGPASLRSPQQQQQRSQLQAQLQASGQAAAPAGGGGSHVPAVAASARGHQGEGSGAAGGGAGGSGPWFAGGGGSSAVAVPGAPGRRGSHLESVDGGSGSGPNTALAMLGYSPAQHAQAHAQVRPAWASQLGWRCPTAGSPAGATCAASARIPTGRAAHVLATACVAAAPAACGAYALAGQLRRAAAQP